VSDATLPRSAPLPPAPGSPEVAYEKCPHCGNATLIEPSKTLVFRCGICGKARVPLDRPGLVRSGAEVPALARASAAHLAATAWRAGAAVLGIFSAIGLLSLFLVTTALNPGAVALSFGVLIALLPAGLAAYGLQRSKQQAALVQPALDEGWQSVAREVIDQAGTLSDVELAKAMRVSRERAEQLLVQLASTSPVRHQLEAAPLTFESPRARVASGQGEGEAPAADKVATDEDLADAEALADADRRARGAEK
jgi:hypothetical protein